MAQAHTATDVEAVLAQCSAAHARRWNRPRRPPSPLPRDAARHERSQRIAIARCLRRLGCPDSAGDESVELVAVSPTSRSDDRHAARRRPGPGPSPTESVAFVSPGVVV